MKLLLYLMIYFIFLCLVGAGYMQYTGGKYNVQFAVPPILFFITWFHEFITFKKKI